MLIIITKMSPSHKKHINNPTPNPPPTTTTSLSQQPPQNRSRSRSKSGSKNYHYKPPRATTRSTAKSPLASTETTTNRKPAPPWKPATRRITRSHRCELLLQPPKTTLVQRSSEVRWCGGRASSLREYINIEYDDKCWDRLFKMERERWKIWQ